MWQPKQRIVVLQTNGQSIRMATDHPVFVQGKGWVNPGDLHAGDYLNWTDGQYVMVEAVTDDGQQAIIHQVDAGSPTFPNLGLLKPGTLLMTSTGLKPVEDIKPGDCICVPNPFDPNRN